MKKNPNINKYNKKLVSVSSKKKYDDPCGLPNPNYKYTKLSKKRRKAYKKQRRLYGFDDSETYDLGYTSTVWLYSHIKMLLDIGGKIVEFDDNLGWSDDFKKRLIGAGVNIKVYNTSLKVFEYICELLEKADKILYDIENADYNPNMTREDIQKENNLTLKAQKMQQKAFNIYGIMLPIAWW